MMKYLLPVLMILLCSSARAQINISYDTYNSNDAVVEHYFDTNGLALGTVYNMSVLGTYSIWQPSYWSAPCGAPESAPMYPSPVGFGTGTVGFDFEFGFAYPNSSPCSGASFPDQTNRMEISLDGGATWFHPSTSTAYNSGHSYQYTVTGEGYPLGIRQVSPLNSDDYGMLEFQLTPQGDPTALNQETALELDIFPNPTTDLVRLDGDFKGSVQVKVFSMSGQLLLDKNFQNASAPTINLQALDKGVYLLEVTTSSSRKVKQIAKI